MKKTEIKSLIEERIVSKIHHVRKHQVMLDFDLAALYDVENKQLKRAVRRNLSRFPKDFMFQLTKAEYQSLRCQIGTLKRGAHSKYLPFAFTEQGVAMLSSVLNSERAVQVNIAIMRTFTKLRQMMMAHKDIKRKIEDIERKYEAKFDNYDKQFKVVFEAIKQLLQPPVEGKKEKIGFHAGK